MKEKANPYRVKLGNKKFFFELPYWKTLNLRHNLDVMHIEKNISERVLGTLMNVEGKSKDTNIARLDLEDMKIIQDCT